MSLSNIKKNNEYPKNVICAIYNVERYEDLPTDFFVSEEAESKLEASLEFAENVLILGQECKEILNLYFKDKMNLKQINEKLNMPYSKVVNLIHGSLNKLDSSYYVRLIYKNGFANKEEYINSPIHIDDHIIKLKLSSEAYNCLMDNRFGKIENIKMLTNVFYKNLIKRSCSNEIFKEIVKKVYDTGFKFKYFDSDVLDDHLKEIDINNDKIYKLNLSDKYYRNFINLGFKTIGDLINYSTDELVKAKYIKPEDVNEIINEVNNSGFKFATNRIDILETDIIYNAHNEALRNNVDINRICFSDYDDYKIHKLLTSCYISNNIKKWIKENPDKLLSFITDKSICTIRCNKDGYLDISK